MGDKKYCRKEKEDRPVIAICYDFDRTLSPVDMQAQGFIQSLGYNINEFWIKTSGLAIKNDMDENLACLYMMNTKLNGRAQLTKETLREYGKRIIMYPGVEGWFERIKSYGEEKNVLIEHYIISSGLKEMIEGTTLAQKGVFTKIYASSYYYDESGVAVWPAQVVNYTNKTQYLFRIEKGTLDVNDPGVNEHFSQERVRVPFRNIIYIGDSDTDIPCMRLVNSHGGHSIGIYDSNKSKVYKMIRDKRIKYYAPADYSEGSDLDGLVKIIIDKTVYNEKLEDYYNNSLREAQNTKGCIEDVKSIM